MRNEDKIVTKKELRNLIIPMVKTQVKDMMEKEIKDYFTNNIIEGNLLNVRDWSYIDEG